VSNTGEAAASPPSTLGAETGRTRTQEQFPRGEREHYDRTVSRSSSQNAIPLERIILISAFQASLRSFLRHSERAARRWDLTPQRHQLLLAIKGAPDGGERLSFSEVADRLQLSRNTVTELCARAEEAGLIRREPADHDQRVVYLRLTKEGDRRLCGVLVENEVGRKELAKAFDKLIDSFRVASKGAR
jgi:DNA-binding MarR family transcriptional regulator